ncbi:MAG TPA: RNA-binding S4 domain-containing protein [Solirubrobacteraceae bacterium]|jgi:ribosome-associated heat shock protein Hsp15|nr:RNA-binding S4 domain-containing protein [Solirubrobacteraceae bacterium]
MNDPNPPDPAAARVRVDRWLWAARFFKSRSLAVDAIKAGRVQVNGGRAKPSREVGPGDRLEITVERVRRVVVVRATSERRGPATEAALLYEETADSLAARARQAAEDRLSRPPGADRSGRPTKRDRRRIDSARG